MIRGLLPACITPHLDPTKKQKQKQNQNLTLALETEIY